MKVLGIDLAAQPERTGVVMLEAAGVRPLLHPVRDQATDDVLVELAQTVDVVGVDAPLGWPVDFVAAVSAHERLEPWLGTVDRSSLCFRRTDEDVRALTGRWPLSVSADKLGVVAMRCALLQERFADEAWGGQRQPRNGRGRLVETCPAGALHLWGLPRNGYKGKEEHARTVRGVIVNGLRGLVDLGELEDASIVNDDTLDAVVSALVAWMAASSRTFAPGSEESRTPRCRRRLDSSSSLSSVAVFSPASRPRSAPPSLAPQRAGIGRRPT